MQRTHLVFTIAVLTAALLSAPAVHAQKAISVNFIGNTSATGMKNAIDPKSNAGVFFINNWNNDSGGNSSGTVAPVYDSQGNAGSTTVTYSAQYSLSNNLETDPNFSTNANYQLMNGYIVSGTDPLFSPAATVTVSSVPFSTYDLYVYLFSGQAGLGTYTFTPSSTGTVQTLNANSLDTFTGQFVDATTSGTGNYIVFHGLSASGFTLSAINGGTDTTYGAPINGFQIVAAAPEPTTVVPLLLGAGVLSFLVWRRRSAPVV